MHSLSAADAATLATAVFAGVSVLVAMGAIYFAWRVQQNQELLSQAVLSLERAYRALTDDGAHVTPPLPDRLNWLTCARHIESFKSLKGRLRTTLHQSLCEEHEEFWRHLFYLSLESTRLLPKSYFAEQRSPALRPGVEPRSAIIIYAFATWPANRTDPIDSVDVHRLIREADVLNARPGFSEYVNSFKQFRDET